MSASWITWNLFESEIIGTTYIFFLTCTVASVLLLGFSLYGLSSGGGMSALGSCVILVRRMCAWRTRMSTSLAFWNSSSIVIVRNGELVNVIWCCGSWNLWDSFQTSQASYWLSTGWFVGTWCRGGTSLYRVRSYRVLSCCPLSRCSDVIGWFTF